MANADSDQAHHQDDRADYLPGDGKARHVVAHQHHRADDEGGNAANADHAERADEGFGHHQPDAEHHQGEPGVVDRQHVEGVERQQDADAASYAGADQAEIDGRAYGCCSP